MGPRDIANGGGDDDELKGYELRPSGRACENIYMYTYMGSVYSRMLHLFDLCLLFVMDVVVRDVSWELHVLSIWSTFSVAFQV